MSKYAPVAPAPPRSTPRRIHPRDSVTVIYPRDVTMDSAASTEMTKTVDAWRVGGKDAYGTDRNAVQFLPEGCRVELTRRAMGTDALHRARLWSVRAVPVTRGVVVRAWRLWLGRER